MVKTRVGNLKHSLQSRGHKLNFLFKASFLKGTNIFRFLDENTRKYFVENHFKRFKIQEFREN